MKIREGISREHILDQIRESVQNDLHCHHLADKNLNNITAAYGLEKIRLYANDQQSFLAWIEE